MPNLISFMGQAPETEAQALEIGLTSFNRYLFLLDIVF